MRFKLAFLLASALAAQTAQAETMQRPSGAIVPPAAIMCWNGVTNADGSQQVVPCGTTANPLPVTAGGYNDDPVVVPTIQAAAYASGNAVGALQTVPVFRTTAQPSGILNNWFLQWLGTETTPLTFYVFNALPSGSTCTDKTAFVLAAADASKLIMPPFTLTAAAPAVGTTLTSANSSFTPLSVKNKDGTPSVNLYVCAVSGGTFTPAVGDLTYKPSMAQD